MHAAHPHPVPTPEDFALVDARYVAVPALLWALAAAAVVVSSLIAGMPVPERSAAPADEAVPLVLGA